MRCINKKLPLILYLIMGLLLTGCSSSYSITAYENEHYNKSLYKGALFATDLCVADTDVSLDTFSADESLNAAGLFDLKNEKVVYSNKIYEQLYPASTTKVMTAYLTLKYGHLDDIVTVSENATNFASDEQVCGLQAGDTATLYDLLCGLVLFSGNDSAVAIAEHISGSVEAFSELMNNEAKALGATGTHFVNPHGLQDTEHYTTAYDLYLMFNACIKDQRFLDIIDMDVYTGTLTDAYGLSRTVDWVPTNYYSQGLANAPEGINVFGGKTGTTDEAGSCVILYSQDMDTNPYISVVMGAADKDLLYSEMSKLMEAGEILQAK